jgi:hypothetical protein
MKRSSPIQFRDNQLYGWPFYITRKLLRASARRMLQAADALISREKYPCPLFLLPMLPENARLKNLHHGKPCVIIGNGPSLRSHDIEAMAGQITIAMNGFVNHPSIGRSNPTYYCLADPVYFDGSAPSSEFLNRLFAIVPQSHLIVPCVAAPLVGQIANPISFVTFSGNLASTSLRRLDLTRPLPNITNCAQLAIMLALYAGCSPIQLIGMDHDWLAHRSHDTHFYTQKTLPDHDAAHGDFSRYPYQLLIEDVLKVWQGYQTLKRYAQRHGQVIVNCSDGGFLDVFERGGMEAATRLAA